MAAEHSNRLLSAAELQQRRNAARSHRSETSPSIRQGSSGAPSRSAIGLFRQGQARPGTGSGRGVWDTRATELPVGSMNASFTFHFPKAYRSKVVAPALRGERKLAVMRLGARKTGEARDLTVTNPGTVVDAHRHPEMRAIATKAITTVDDHLAGTIETGQARKLIPEGTAPGLVRRAYRHAALLALHKAGLGDYDFHMDDSAKGDFTPLVPFMRYAQRRVFDRLNTEEGVRGKWQPFREEFGRLHVQRKNGKETGVTRMRMRPNDQFVKIEPGEDEPLAKAFERAESKPDSRAESGNRERPGNKNGHNAHSIARIALIRAIAAHRVGIGRGGVKHVPEPPGGDFPGRHDPGMHIKDAAKLVEAHYGVKVGNAPRGAVAKVEPIDGALIKMDLGFSLGGSTPAPNLGGYDIDPERQLRRAIRPRLKRNAFRLRLNTQRHLRTALNGGVTRQERWQLGASARLPADPFHLGKAFRLPGLLGSIGRRKQSLVEIGGHDLHREINRRYNALTERVRPARAQEERLPPQLKAATNDELRTEAARRLRLKPKTLTLSTMHGKAALLPGRGHRVRDTSIGAVAGLATGVGLSELRSRKLGKRSHVDDAAEVAAHPTDAQAEAGNYRMGHVQIAGHNVTIETPKGRTRRKVSKSGKAWQVVMPAHYGYIKRTEGADGDHVDVYVGPHGHQAERHPVFVVDQQHADTGRFDEHKVMLGFKDAAHATRTYDRAFSDRKGPARRRAVHELHHDDFHSWLRDGDTTKPFSRPAANARRSDQGGLGKGILGTALKFGQATALRTRAAALMGGQASRNAGMAARRVAGGLGQAAASTRVGAAGIRTAGNVAAHPRVAPALAEATRHGARSFTAMGDLAGRTAGAAIAGERGAKIGGKVGLAADYVPQAYVGYQVARGVLGAKDPAERQVKRNLQTGTTAQRAVGSVLGKSAIGAIARAVNHAPTGVKLSLGALAGGTIYANRHVLRDHPGARSATGAALAGAAVAAVSRGHALGAIRRSTRSMYMHGVAPSHLKAMLRDHMRVLDGATPSPDHIRQVTLVNRKIRGIALQQAKQSRKTQTAAIRLPTKTIAGASAAGGALGLLATPRQETQQ